MSIGHSPEILSQRILAGIILVGIILVLRLGARRRGHASQAGGLAGRRAGLQAGRALFCSISSVGTSMSSLDSRLSFCPSAPRRHRRVTALPPFAWSFLSLVARGAPPAPLLAPPFRHVRRGEARKRLGPARRWRGGRALPLEVANRRRERPYFLVGAFRNAGTRRCPPRALPPAADLCDRRVRGPCVQHREPAVLLARAPLSSGRGAPAVQGAPPRPSVVGKSDIFVALEISGRKLGPAFKCFGHFY